MNLQEAIKKVVLSNRILSNENVVDAFGHVSVRNPENPNEFLLSRSLPPSLVTEDDIMRHDLEGNVLDKDYKPYLERILHAKIYQARPDVQAICHNHAAPLLPFTTTGIEIKTMVHFGSMFYEGVPFYDDYDVSDGMLIKNKTEGERIARTLGDKRAMLLRGHGAIVVGNSLEEVVMCSVYLAANAEVQYRSMQMGGQMKCLSYEEGRAATETMLSPLPLERAWKYWVDRAQKTMI